MSNSRSINQTGRQQRPSRVFYVDQPVKCVECGRTTKRRSLRQIHCSERCSKKARQRDHRYRKAVQKALDVACAGVVPDARRIPPKKASFSAGSESPKSGSSNPFSIPVDLVGGSARRWPGSARLSPDLRRAILDAETGVSLHNEAPSVAALKQMPRPVLAHGTGAKSNPPKHSNQMEIGRNEDMLQSAKHQ
jgi:hypothetical protein